jgi:hypothetical protein
MSAPDWPTALPQNFGGLEDEFSALANSKAVVLPVPLRLHDHLPRRHRNGPRAILAASQNMELYDEEIGAILPFRHSHAAEVERLPKGRRPWSNAWNARSAGSSPRVSCPRCSAASTASPRVR